MLRTHCCGEMRKEHIGERVTLAGWVNRRRDHGGLIFIDLRDREGVVQAVFNPDVSAEALKVAEGMRNEFVVKISGEVARRPVGTENMKLPTGEIEIIIDTAEVLNASRTPPFNVNEDIDVDESVRQKYRYLDLRRGRLQDNLHLRHRVTKFMRDFLDARGFIEVETPILIKSTPEGARDYLVPSRLHPGKFYALPQSPQQLKQLLMVSGYDRYYQIARCFRDEDTRAGRQPEFTQLDFEMSFVEEEDVIGLLEELYTAMIPVVRPEMRLQLPIPRLTYAEAMERWGTDKPDLRYGMEIKDLSDILRDSGFGIFSQAIASGGCVRGICAPGCAAYTRSQLEDLNRIARDCGAGGAVTIALDSAGSLASLTPEMIKSAAAKYLTTKQVGQMAGRLEAKMGDLLLLVAGGKRLACTVLGELRREMGQRLNLADGNVLAFASIIDFPMFYRDPKTGKLLAMHHPFTEIKESDLPRLEKEPERVISKSYDFVCNGHELSSGSIRIHTSDMQRRVLNMLGYTDEDIDARFGHLLEAFDYGAPPHGGAAPGIDRTVMLLAGEENIREVVAFPKNQSAADLTFEAPSAVTGEQLDELHICLKEEQL